MKTGESVIYTDKEKRLKRIAYCEKYNRKNMFEDYRHPYILKHNNELAGFVLHRYNEENMNEIAEFFVLYCNRL